jgi:KDO2-lipid IV(A) lauroyltransferase
MTMLDHRQDPALLARGCELDGLEHLRAAMADGRGAVLLATHMGNMALPLIKLVEAGWPVTVVYRRARMMSANFLQAGLERYGIQGIPANNGIQAYGQILSALKQGRVVLVMLDQGSSVARGVMQNFLGKSMPMPAGPAQLIRVSRAPVLPLVMTQARPLWRYAIEPPVYFGSGPMESDVALLSQMTEQQILRAPQFWSWHHRRWAQLPASRSPSSNRGAGDRAGNRDQA